MSNKLNYPIKYAVLELKEKGGYSVGYNDITQGFIASKCYVVESSIIYQPDGSNKISHKVVFPYQNIEKFKMSLRNGGYYIGEEEIPRYDANGMVYPVNVVSKLFDTYELAKIEADEKNEKYKINLSFKVPLKITDPKWKDQYYSLREEYEKRLVIANLFEELVLEKTKNMNNDKPYKKILKA